MYDAEQSLQLRVAAMDWLEHRPALTVDYSWLSGFEYDGRRVPLMDPQRGIRKPAGMAAALSIRTTYTDPRRTPPYNDAIGADGLQRYKYREGGPDHPENAALRQAMRDQLPLIWFVGTAPGRYEPIFPVWIAGDEPRDRQFALALDVGQRLITPGSPMTEDTRRYVERITKARLHQRVFRVQVIGAYQGRCAVCRLGHAELLDAAHIIEDGRPGGEPVVPNGLSLCKIHHAAFDNRIVGIRPDLSLHIRQDVLDEIDGPMLRFGLQDLHNNRLEIVPSVRAARPDPVRLEERYAGFLAVG